MRSQEIREKFLGFMKVRGHAIVPSSSLIPEDPSVLFTTAGMQQFKKYFTGELEPVKDFGSKSVASVQKCFRTSDIDEVGDDTHLTFFEMLGNFSFGGYWKEEAIKLAHEFITKEMGLAIDYVTYFDPEKVPAGDWRKGVPKDEESPKVWKELGITDVRPDGVDVFWGPTGNEGPCGPTTEIYVNGVEVWNIVFNEFYRDKENNLKPLEIKGVDTGMGLERLTVMVQKVENVYETDLFKYSLSSAAISQKASLPEVTFPKNYSIRDQRIIADHVRAVALLVKDGIRPSNKDQGYALRRLIRRVVTMEYVLGTVNFDSMFASIDEEPGEFYWGTETYAEEFEEIFKAEKEKFLMTLKNGLKELERASTVDVKQAFMLFQSYGLPYEVIKDYAKEKAQFTRESFDAEFAKHQEISRAGAEKKFGGHGLILDTGELKASNEDELKKVLALHTATHLLHQALRETLGNEVSQKGSDITAERARFDFSFPRKLTPEEVKAVEGKVNAKIRENLTVSCEEMPKAEAEKTGALHFFNGKYPDMVKVYSISPDGTQGNAWSKEFCNGPHVSHTGEIGGIKIVKEEAVSSGTRRIRFTLSG
jgi:alanyl-tRNA synthetase